MGGKILSKFSVMKVLTSRQYSYSKRLWSSRDMTRLDLETSDTVNEVAASVLASDQNADLHSSLILLWDELIEDRSSLKVIVEDIWKEYSR